MEGYTVWVDVVEKIASFHEIKTGELMKFDQRELFINYLYTLTEQSYRFQ